MSPKEYAFKRMPKRRKAKQPANCWRFVGEEFIALL